MPAASIKHSDELSQPKKRTQPSRSLTIMVDALFSILASLKIAVGRTRWSAATRTMNLAPGVASERRLLTRRSAPSLRAATPPRPIGPKSPLFGRE